MKLVLLAAMVATAAAGGWFRSSPRLNLDKVVHSPTSHSHGSSWQQGGLQMEDDDRMELERLWMAETRAEEPWSDALHARYAYSTSTPVMLMMTMASRFGRARRGPVWPGPPSHYFHQTDFSDANLRQAVRFVLNLHCPEDEEGSRRSTATSARTATRSNGSFPLRNHPPCPTVTLA